MDERVREFHCIMPLANVGSVMEGGILSHEAASKINHQSAAMQEIQDRRDKKSVPGGLRLHQYANLYFHARNPMLYKRRAQAANLCVLQVSIDVRHLAGVVITDRNAASDWVRFLDPRQYRLLNFDSIFAMDWTHPNDAIAYQRHKSEKCAEILVPRVVEPRFLVGAYVVNKRVGDDLRRVCELPITVNAPLFFY
jgi:hypothetical protein